MVTRLTRCMIVKFFHKEVFVEIQETVLSQYTVKKTTFNGDMDVSQNKVSCKTLTLNGNDLTSFTQMVPHYAKKKMTKKFVKKLWAGV